MLLFPASSPGPGPPAFHLHPEPAKVGPAPPPLPAPARAGRREDRAPEPGRASRAGGAAPRSARAPRDLPAGGARSRAPRPAPPRRRGTGASGAPGRRSSSRRRQVLQELADAPARLEQPRLHGLLVEPEDRGHLAIAAVGEVAQRDHR